MQEPLRNLQPEVRDLLVLSQDLAQRELRLRSHWPDYSFLVFPAAKAYEGFLKQYLYDLGLIQETQFRGKNFRIGRALNPDVPAHQRDQWWLFDDVAQRCGPAIARQLWNTWLECRNQVFHFFPHEVKPLTLSKALEKLALVESAIHLAQTCQLKSPTPSTDSRR